MKDISLPTKNNSFKLNAITHLLGIMGIIPLFFVPSSTTLAQNCIVTRNDYSSGTSYSVSSPTDTCHISDEDARKIANLGLRLEGEGIITLNGDIALDYLHTMWTNNNNGSFKLNGSATLNSHVFLNNSTISKNAKFTSDSQLNNTTIGGDLNINDTNYHPGPGFRPFLQSLTQVIAKNLIIP